MRIRQLLCEEDELPPLSPDRMGPSLPLVKLVLGLFPYIYIKRPEGEAV